VRIPFGSTENSGGAKKCFEVRGGLFSGGEEVLCVGVVAVAENGEIVPVPASTKDWKRERKRTQDRGNAKLAAKEVP